MATGAQADEEAGQDVMDEDIELSAMNAGAREFIYEHSQFENDNCAPVSNL